MRIYFSFFFFFNNTATTEIYTLSLHDALPISSDRRWKLRHCPSRGQRTGGHSWVSRSEEHTSELQSQFHLVCRLLLEKKKKFQPPHVKLNAIFLCTTPSAPMLANAQFTLQCPP